MSARDGRAEVLRRIGWPVSDRGRGCAAEWLAPSSIDADTAIRVLGVGRLGLEDCYVSRRELDALAAPGGEVRSRLDALRDGAAPMEADEALVRGLADAAWSLRAQVPAASPAAVAVLAARLCADWKWRP